MKKSTQKLLTIALAFLMIFAIAVPVAMAAPGSETGNTDVVITKIGMESLAGWPKTGDSNNITYDGSQITNMQGYFGDHTLMGGVVFEVYRGTTDADVIPANFVGTYTTSKDEADLGTVTMNLPPGDYYIIENKEASTYVGPGGEVLNSYAAVPITLTLPMIREDGTYFGTLPNDTIPGDTDDALYVYPKNTDEKPTTEKDFADIWNPGNNAGETRPYTIGDSIPYRVQSMIPANSVYKTLIWEDVMTPGLTYNKDLVLTATGAATADTTFTEGTHYTIYEHDRGYTLVFNEAGLTKLAAATALGDVNFTLNYSATLNEDAVVDVPEENDVKLIYGNAPREESVPVTPLNGQMVISKTWAGGTAPAGVVAVFDVYDDTGTFVQSVTLNAENGWTATVTGLTDGRTYTVVERYITGYTPEYTNNVAGALTVSNVPDTNPGPIDPVEPEVITGGKKFVKTDDATTDPNRLANGRFVIKNNITGDPDNGKYLAVKTAAQTQALLDDYNTKQATYLAEVAEALAVDDPDTPEDETNAQAIADAKAARDTAYQLLNEEYAWVANVADAYVFVSGPNGEFQVEGLEYGNFLLEEIAPPPGYAEMADVPFIVGPGTFTTHPQGILYLPAGTTDTAQQVVNKKITIPQTGGIGTVIFTVAGLALMGVSVLALKRRREAE